MRRGKVNFAGICIEVSLDYIPEAGVGDYVLVHVGFALTLVDEREAKEVSEALRPFDELQNELQRMLRTPSARSNADLDEKTAAQR